MSQSITFVHLNEEIKEWLDAQAIEYPNSISREANVSDLVGVLDSNSDLTVSRYVTGHLENIDVTNKAGMSASVLCSPSHEDGQQSFHFRGGDLEFIKFIAKELSAKVGTQVIVDHSGDVLGVC